MNTNIQEMTREELLAALEQQRTENVALKSQVKAPGFASGDYTISCKVSDKGAVSVYGLGRFPVTLYRAQWIALIQAFDFILNFMKDNTAQLDKSEAAHKAAKVAAKAA